MFGGRKPKQIGGVSASSVVDLKAVLAQEQQARKTGTSTSTASASVQAGTLARGKFLPQQQQPTNRGVEDRNRRDLEQMREDQEANPSLDRVDAKLREKSELHRERAPRKDRFGRDIVGDDKDDDFAVDFEQKNLDYVDEVNSSSSSKKRKHNDAEDGFYWGHGQFYHEDIERENERRRWEEETRRTAEEEAEEARKRVEQRTTLHQLMAETREGREKHRDLQLKRKLAKMSRSEQIKQRAALIKEKQHPGEEIGPNSADQASDQASASAADESNRLRLKRPKLS